MYDVEILIKPITVGDYSPSLKCDIGLEESWKPHSTLYFDIILKRISLKSVQNNIISLYVRKQTHGCNS